MDFEIRSFTIVKWSSNYEKQDVPHLTDYIPDFPVSICVCVCVFHLVYFVHFEIELELW